MLLAQSLDKYGCSKMLDKMLEQFKDFSELQAFAEAQQNTIVQQSKKIRELEAEVERLKTGASPISSGVLHLPTTIGLNDEEAIARIQLAKLKDISENREFTLEEARKLEIYSKIINAIENRPKKEIIPTKAMSVEDLSKLLTGSNE
jgi:hypothetical protein